MFRPDSAVAVARSVLGREAVFETHELIHNRRVIQRIEVAAEGDGGFAVVDVDTLWRDREGNDFHWSGRSCKIYTSVQQTEGKR